MKTAVDTIASQKHESNVENSVGLIALKYSGPEIILHLTEERRWNSEMAKVKLSHGRGTIPLHDAIKKARLALKHRRNIKQEKKIVAIVCSPVDAPIKTLRKVGKDLKKNGLTLDIICFGVPEDEPTNTVEKLKSMVEACCSADNCHFLHVPDENTTTLQNAVRSSPIYNGPGFIPAAANQQDAAPVAAAGNDGAAMDPNEDPELQWALRLSMEQYRAEAEAQNTGEQSEAAPEQKAEPEAEAPADAEMEEVEEDEDEDLRKALAMSMADDDDEDELAKALQLSMQDDADDTPAAPANNAQNDEPDEERAFLVDLMAELPGVEPEEVDYEALLNDMEEETDKPPEKKDDEKK